MLRYLRRKNVPYMVSFSSKTSYLCSLLFFWVGITAISACKDESDDFTSGNFYPIDPKEVDPVTPIDTTTVIDPPDSCWVAPISITKAGDFNNLFTRFGGGWTGGDATYSIPLPDGRVLWLFGDSFMGTVKPDRSRPPSGFQRNAFVVQDGTNLTTLTGGATAYMTPTDAGWWYWPGHGNAYNDTLQVVLFGFKSTGGGAWDFGYASVDVATFHLPDFTLLSLERKVVDPATNYGACLLEDGGYTYIYGSEKVGFSKFLHVARVKGRNLNGPWEYFTGMGWSADPMASGRVLASVSDQFSVFKKGDKFYLMTQHHILGGEIYLYDSDTPAVGFDHKRTIYCTPEHKKGNLFTYNAFAHPEFSNDGALLVSYNVNSFVFGDLFQNADNYRPYFVRVRVWE
jgi:hypothetical protein